MDAMSANINNPRRSVHAADQRAGRGVPTVAWVKVPPEGCAALSGRCRQMTAPIAVESCKLHPWNGRRRHRAAGAAAWRILGLRRTPDPRARPGIWVSCAAAPGGGCDPCRPRQYVAAVWRARIDEHLGTYVVEGTRLRAASVLTSSHAVYGVTHLASLARLLPERDPHEDIYEMLERTLDDFDDIGEAAVHLVRFELAMLPNSVSGSIWKTAPRPARPSTLPYVSPKSGGAVSRAAGDPWRDRLLRLPPSCARTAEGPTAGRIRT